MSYTSDSTILLSTLLAIALWLMARGTRPAGLYALTGALLLAASAALHILRSGALDGLLPGMSHPQAANPLHDTYYVVSGYTSLSHAGLFLLVTAAILWFQSRAGAMFHPRLVNAMLVLLLLSLFAFAPLAAANFRRGNPSDLGPVLFWLNRIDAFTGLMGLLAVTILILQLLVSIVRRLLAGATV